MDTMLTEILDALGPEALGPEGLRAGRTDPIAQVNVERWASSDDIETLGALCALLDSVEFRDRIQPPISLDQHHALFLRYTERCLLEDPRGEWAASRYEAGWALARWFLALWSDEAVPRQRPLEIKQVLGRLYKAGDEELRVSIVNATLEHLFEDRSIATYFKEWEKDPLLAQAYDQAMLWSRKGGTSPSTNHLGE